MTFMSYQRNLPYLIFFTLTTFLTIVRGQTSCLENGNYTSNSTYGTNLNTLLASLSTNIDENGFYNASLGESPDRVHAFALCRGDTDLNTCRICVRNATADILRICPNNRQAIRWLTLCTLRYSDEPLFGIMDVRTSWMWSRLLNATNTNQFTSDLVTLITSLRVQASNGGPLRKVAAGNISTSGFLIIFALEQCTPDLSAQDCDACLLAAAQLFPTCCDGLVGASVSARSCNVYYDNFRFYNETRLRELAFVPSPPPTPSQPAAGNDGNRSNNTTTIIIAVVSVAAGLSIAALIGFLIWKRNQKPKRETKPVDDDISVVESLQYDFGVIKAATDGFSEANTLGKGGFGLVYKGKLPNGQEVAVKRLSSGSSQGDLEFKNEVMLLVKLQHRNLVRLFGFSIQGPEKLLVYEFMENAGLDQLLFDPTKRSLLDWDTRYKIIGGIARGILYLHEDSRLMIIHRDLKASNVLLDGDMNPKIADFGMARLFVADETRGSTSRIVGTYGYMAPEYATRGHFSVKSDVFSFGVLLLEIISGQRNYCFQHGETKEDLISSAWKNWHEGTASNLVDPVLKVGPSIGRDIFRCIHIGLLCVQENATDRPTMASVILMLNSSSITLPLPSHSAFSASASASASSVYNDYSSESSLLQVFSEEEGNFNRSLKNMGAESSDSFIKLV